MATQNDFLPFATGPGANVVDQATYAALGALTTGFLSGTAQSMQLNKVWRQSSIMSAVIAQFIVAQTGQAAVDDGTTPTLLANFTKAVNAASKQRVILTDTGSVNALAAANAVPMTALPTVSGVVQTVAVKVTNTGAATYSPDGLASRPIFGLGGAALQGGEMPANGIATLVSYVGPLLNGGDLCWVLFECVGGAQQVAPATQSQHAMQLGQATGRLLNVQRFTSSATYNPTPGTTKLVVELWGGGGGGAGCPSTSAGQAAVAGGGGGGAYLKALITSGFSGGVSVTVGSGGSAGVAGLNSGGSGGTSSFGSMASAAGGTGSSPTPAGVPPLIGGAGGSGVATGAPGGTVLDTSIGAAGGPAFAQATGASLGGSGGGSGGHYGPIGGVAGQPGIAGASAGCGGSGGSQGASGGALAGGAGAPGQVLVWEYA
ncbi:glycine-rich domain-containing protein [Burkholderia multivorans]|uniref:glycine-rich domain-containing protein n=1 Tax=Burkholderia multivorans TaxID=87883 RepID=UPI0021594EE5|nr:hypothetical protein [Burkholderia multivorans]